jgi:hypothetical protein
MTTRKRQQTVEKLEGIGKVYIGEEWLADVVYSLSVQQEFLSIRTQSGTSTTRPGLKNIRGEISVIKGQEDFAMNNQGPFTLRLQDGRKWEFLASLDDLTPATYQVVDAGEGLLDSQD